MAVAAATGMVFAGPVAAVVTGVATYVSARRWRRRTEPLPVRLILILLLLEIRSGRSILAAVSAAAETLPEHPELRRVARVALVAGLPATLDDAPEPLRPLLAELTRAQRSGASVESAVRRLLDEDLAEERASRLARARSLPVRLMVPVTLLMLPGLVLALYAPSLFQVFHELTGAAY